MNAHSRCQHKQYRLFVHARLDDEEPALPYDDGFTD